MENPFKDISPVKKENNILESKINFTKDQEIAVNNLIDFIKSKYNPNNYIKGLVGAAGTGKTFILKYIINNCGLSNSVIGLATPTHKACRVLHEATGLKVNTIQSDLGLRLNFNIDNFDINNPPFDPMGKIKINKYSLYIIDEASMINKGLKILIERTCKKYECKIIYVGDSFQLAPVKELYSSAFKGIEIFSLNQIIRQGDDNPISELLVILRNDIKNKTFNFLNHIIKNNNKFNLDETKGYEVLNDFSFNKLIVDKFNNEEYTKNVDLLKVIAYTNSCVNFWNKVIRTNIIKNADTSIITKHDLITSYTTIVDEFNSPIIKNSEEYVLKDVVNYRDKIYDLDGFMVRFIAIHGGEVSKPLFILNHNDKFSFQMYCKIHNELIDAATKANNKYSRAAKWKEYYEFKENVLLLTNISDNSGKIVISRDLDYGFALTSHKSQGSTYNNIFVDVKDIVYNKNRQPYSNAEEINRRLYVACSRAKNKLYLKY